MYNQLSIEIEDWIKFNNVYIIHLIRKNILKLIISGKTAKKRNLWHATSKTRISPIKIHLPINTLLWNISKIENKVINYSIKFNTLPYINIYYEDLIADKQKVADQVFKFLKVDSFQNLQLPFKKINPDSLEKILKNYEDVKKILIGSKYEHFSSLPPSFKQW